MDPGVLTRRRIAGGAAGLVLAGALLSGCGSGPGAGPPAAAAFHPADCPARITVEVLTPVSCGFVTVPERHADPSSPRIALFVARVQPPGPASGEPVLWLGYDVGGTVEYGSMATLAPRVHREVVIVDSRGTGFSRPHLGCPEVAAVAPTLVALPSGAQAGRDAYQGAVAACHQRLTDGGVDVPAYGLDELAADVRDVMGALDVPTADLFTGGTYSRALAPLLADADDGAFRSAVVDNGSLGTVPDEQLTAAALDEAMSAADVLCDDACAVTGRPSELLPVLTAQLDRTPLATTTQDGSPVVLDGTRLRGIAAWWLERHVGGALLAQQLSDAAAGHSDQGPLLDAERVLCLGLRPKCEAPDFSYGVWWTVRCRNEAPRSATLDADVCSRWPVGTGEHVVPAPVSAVPVLALYGALDPYVPAGGRALAGMSRQTVVVDPSRGADVMIGCARPWRNRWIDDLQTEPVDVCPGSAPPVTGTRTWD